jgi:hypothetical protein
MGVLYFIHTKTDLLLLMAGKSLYTVYKEANSVKENSGVNRRKLHEAGAILAE